MTEGHPCFIANAGRIGFSADDLHRYAPEFGPRMRLNWLAVWADDVEFAAMSDVDYDSLLDSQLGAAQRARFDANLIEQGLDPADYRYLPAHPGQWANRAARLFASEVAARRLVEAGHEPVVVPLSEVGALSPALPPADRVDLVAATSANALRHLPPAPPELFARPCWTVGARTAEAARRAGFTDVRAADGDGAALAALILAASPHGATVLYLCGRVRRPEFERTLGLAGMKVEVIEVYDTRFVPPRQAAMALAAAGPPIDAVLLFSPETARAMASILDLDETAGLLADAAFLCLSAQVADALGTLGRARTYVPMEPTEDALLALLPPG